MTSLLPRLSRDAWTVLAGDFVSAVGSGLTLPLLLVYLHQVRGISYGTAGLILATVAAASLVGNPVGGELSDRWSPRSALVLGLLVSACGAVGLACVHSPWQGYAAAAVAGLGASVAWPAQDALLATVVVPEQRPAVFSVRFATMNAGLGLGALVAAGAVSVTRPHTFVAVYLADAATFVAYVPVLLLLRCAPPAAEPQPPVGYRQVLADRAFRRVWLLLAFVVLVSYGQFHSGLPGYAARPGGISTHALGVAFAANTVTIVVTQLFVLRRLQGHRRTTGVALASLAWAATWGLVALGGQLGHDAPAVATFVLSLMVFGVGESLLAPTLTSVINDLATDESRGRYNGLGALAFTAGSLVGPSVAGAALDHGAGTLLFLALVGACGLGAVAALRLARHLPAAANLVPA